MRELDEAIHRVEDLYRSLTGHDAPATEAPYAPIPPERDPVEFVDAQLERLLRALPGTAPARPVASFAPPMTVAQSGDELAISVDLPGVARESVEVSITQNLLLIAGERALQQRAGAVESWRVHASERPLGRFRRALALPPGALVDQLSAEMKDGVLEIRVPCPQPAGTEPRTIPVR
jgi:HSP20 family molecular chaperone IbpA